MHLLSVSVQVSTFALACRTEQKEKEGVKEIWSCTDSGKWKMKTKIILPSQKISPKSQAITEYTKRAPTNQLHLIMYIMLYRHFKNRFLATNLEVVSHELGNQTVVV